MNSKVFKRRVYITTLITLVIAISFIVKLSTLHFSNKIIVPSGIKPEIRRGYIRDRNGYIMAISIESGSIFANPMEIKNPTNTSKILSSILNISAKKVENRLKRKKKFIWIKRKVDNTSIEKIKKLNIKGLYIRKEYKRVYPNDSLASNIIGFVGIDNQGLEGIEYKFNRILSGEDLNIKDKNQLLSGKNITLTIDRFIQHTAEKNLHQAIKKYKAKQGAAVVLEIKTGRVLALAKYPSFNLNHYYRYPLHWRRNFTIIDSFEPGSTLKVISFASVLGKNPGAVNFHHKCTGKIKIAETTINCPKIHGNVTFPEILKYSCNTGTIHLIKTIKKRDFYKTLVKFGFGKKTGIELPGETEGILRTPKSWSGLSKYSMSIGHEISVTSIQLASAIGAIGNMGVYIKPTIIESIEKGNGQLIQKFFPKSKGRIISPALSKKLLKLMRGVVTDGTGSKAHSRYYAVAGKTGTSRKFSRKGNRYSDRVISSFIGLAPYKNPQICVLIIIDEPENQAGGGTAAAPVFSSIISETLPYLGIKKRGLLAKRPLRLKKKVVFDKLSMPEFRGLNLSQSIKLLVKIEDTFKVRYVIKGTGKVYGQFPVPGTKFTKSVKNKIILHLKN